MIFRLKGGPCCMDAVLSDITALAYWQRNSEDAGSVLVPWRMAPERRSVPSIEAPSKALADDLASLGLADREDIHLFVGPAENKRVLKGVTCSVCSCPLPRNSFVRALGRFYVVCPELLFIQLAHELDFVPLLEVGHELCGTYRLGEDGPVYGKEPLTSVAKLRDYARRAEGVRGRRRALQAIQWLADGSASPAETALSIMFRLPYRYGGYGLGNPVLNYEITLSPAAARIVGRQTLRPDHYWIKAKHPCEFDGLRFHAAREQLEYDERRRNAYAAMGMSVTVITTRHMCNPDLMDDIATSIRRNTGIRQGKLPSDYAIKHYALFNEVFSFWTSLKAGGASDEEVAWKTARYDAPEEPW